MSPLGGSVNDLNSGKVDFTLGQLDYLFFTPLEAAVFEGIQNPRSETNAVLNNSFSCLNQSVISLSDDCTSILSSSMFTMPSSSGLFIYTHPLEIPSSFQPGEIGTLDTVYGEGNWMYGLYSSTLDEKGLHQLICWGTFTTEDKIDPFFVGDTTGLPDDLTTVWDESRFQQYGTYKEIYYAAWEDSLNPIGTQFRPGLWSCYQDVSNPLDSSTWPNDLARRYDTLSFTLSSNDQILTIFAASKLNTNTLDSTAGFDPTIALYRGDFDPTSPCENMVGYAASTFIPNPLAGLGFSNDLQNSSKNFAPWLQHPHPLARMEFKAKAGQKYTLVITHKDGPALNHARYNVYFLLNDYKSNSGRIVTNLPGRVYPDSLGVDTAFAYFDFLCYDLEAVMLKNQKTYPSDATVNADRYYTGGNIWQMSKYLGAAEPGLAGGYTVENRNAMNQQWRLIGEALLSVPGRDRDGSFLDLNQANVYPGPYSVVSGGMTFSLTRSRSQEGDVQDSRSLLDTLLRDYAFAPMVLENCGQWEVKAIDQYTAFGDCGIDVGNSNVAGIITRSWVVSDKRNKTDLDTAFTQLIFRNPNLYDVRLPHYTVSLDCEEVSGEGLPSPSITGYPFVSTLTGFVDLTPNQSVCNLAAGYEDKAVVTNCANNKEFRREWTVYDWCRPGTTIIYNQLIRVGDFTAPVISQTTTSLTTNFNADGCTGSVTITRGSAQDVCGSVSIGIKLIYLNGATIAFSPQNLSAQGQNTNTGSYGTVTQIPGITASVNAQGSMEVRGLGEGKYYVEWEAKDACSNASTARDSFTITDNISPSCVIDDERTITLTDFQVGGNTTNPSARGEAYLTADRLDEGSWDNCHVVSVQVRRMTTEWADHVKFTCEDEGKRVLVEMIARAGNDSTICWTNIKVEDKTIPACREIGTVTMLCSDLPAGDLSTGSSVWDQFFADSITVTKTSVRQLCNIEFNANIETEVNIDQCGYGWVNRYYRVYRTIDEKEFADTCRMSIVFSEDHDYWVTFPADEANKECGSLEEVKVTYHEGGCDLITISKNDQKFDATADECYKIIRTYRVINWCEYDGAEVAYQVARRDWNRDGIMGDATTVNVKYRQGVQHIYWDYQNRYVTVVGAQGSLNPTGAAQSDLDRRDTVYRVGAQNLSGDTVYWESASPVGRSQVTTAHNNGTVLNIRKYAGIHPTPIVPIHTDDYIPQGFFEYTQHLKVFDRNTPELEVLTEDLNFASYSNNKDNGCAAPVSIVVKVSDDCTSNLSELVIWDVLLDRDNNNSTGSITFLNKKYDASTSQGTTLYKAEYAGGTLTISSTGLPVGEHKFTVVASDGCGNVQTKDIVFEVEDKKGPAPVCIEGLVVELMVSIDGKGGMGLIKGSDLVVNSLIDDCSGDTGKYRITKLSSNQTVPNLEIAGEELIITCADIDFTGLPMKVAVIAEDFKGNKDYCVTNIEIQDNFYRCGFIIISGQINLENSHPIGHVEIDLNDGNVINSDDRGKYEVHDVPVLENLILTPRKSGDIYEGISTYDLILITQHILGVKPLESPYQIIAADVNNSGSVTTLDVIELRRIILRKQEKFSNNKVWRFIPKSLAFADALNPWKNLPYLNEFMVFNQVNRNIENADFIAVKTGDVNLSVAPRSLETFFLDIDDVYFEKNQIQHVVFYGSNKDVVGFQLGLKHKNLEIINIREEKLHKENFGDKYAEKEVVLISWNGDGAQGALFSIDFKAKKQGWLSDFLEVSPAFLNTEAYDQQGQILTVDFKITNSIHFDFALFQNYPNPFSEETFIRFELPNSGKVEWVVYDMLGKEIKKAEQNFFKGSNLILLKASELGGDGLYFFELRYGDFREVKKIVVKSLF
jgi:hypothetical protein